jgi:hypothetical protein
MFVAQTAPRVNSYVKRVEMHDTCRRVWRGGEAICWIGECLHVLRRVLVRYLNTKRAIHFYSISVPLPLRIDERSPLFATISPWFWGELRHWRRRGFTVWCHWFCLIRALSVPRPNVVEGSLDFELIRSWYVCISEVTRISIFAKCVTIVEENENNQFTIVTQRSWHEGKPFWRRARICVNTSRNRGLRIKRYEYFERNGNVKNISIYNRSIIRHMVRLYENNVLLCSWW